jgi:hypothetical protein
MVNSDIRLHCTFKGHRKRLRLGAWLGDKATDYLIDLWLSVAEERPLGILTGWDEKDIACAGGYPLDAKRFVEALTDCKLLELREGVYVLHDWEEHQPWAVHFPERSAAAKEAARIRWDNERNAERMRDASEAHSTSMPDAMPRTPSPTPIPKPKKIVDSEFLTSMKSRFPLVDVDLEWQHCQVWCAEKRKNASPSRFMNWLKNAKTRQPESKGMDEESWPVR